ncbi:PREDICTED: uncharacterized protein LOC104805547 [Tarenaya hassleriana]|uniref:uncharacterized protein LOC104805547 n=1 Tax=Tarenaya hassleriana TaxID=28532 RepID=UPI00053C5A5A|nr:PREDICTED: uncharacterized protein LOC104805547 [Tarenaya hassleriana]
MYVTRPLSLYRKSPTSLSEEPPEGPFSGVLVITDEEAEAEDTFCFGICKRTRVKKFPFPQDKILSVVHTDNSSYRESSVTKVLFLPVLDQPLSSNRYYVIHAKGRHKGKACVCFMEIDKGICCLPGILQDKKPKPLDPRNIYHTVKIHRHHGHTFFAKSIAPGSKPPSFLKKKGWELQTSRSLYPWRLREALGLDEDLRNRLPGFDFSVSTIRSGSVIVGEWYCPFVFVREPCRPRHQMRKSAFYKMTLSQYWERIYQRDNTDISNNENTNENDAQVVNVDVNVEREASYVMGMEAVRGEKEGVGGFYWYSIIPKTSEARRMMRKRRRMGLGLGLSFAVVERMKRVEEEGGFVGGRGRMVNIKREEKIRVCRSENGESDSRNRWRRFGCYVLVESFGLRRADGTLLLKCVFRHSHRVRCKWE